MKDISEIQKNLIKFFGGREIEDDFELIKFLQGIDQFLNEKSPDEPIDAELHDIWMNNKNNFKKESLLRRGYRISPESVKEIDKLFKQDEIRDKSLNINISDDTKITFILGAGASAPSGIPTVSTLLPELWKRAKKIGREDLDNLSNWCDDQEIDNIEDLLTAAYISDFAVKNGKVNSLLGYFLFSRGKKASRIRENYTSSQIEASSISFLQDTLQTLFGLLASTMISAEPNPTHTEIVNFIKKHPRTSIVTTNYDGCMDEALLNSKVLFRSMINEGSMIKDNNQNAVELIKMHGSINWVYCESCQEVKEFGLQFLKNAYNEDTLSYPVMGLCKNCGGLRRPLLVPPLSFKILTFPKLIDLWNLAREKIEEADYLIVVGYSFAEADTYITKIIARSMSMNKNQKMIIIDTNQTLVQNLRDRFEVLINGFDPERIIKVSKSCDKVMGDLLGSMLNENNA
jgi:NAD-dependent SIR2 family protein deacetylase